MPAITPDEMIAEEEPGHGSSGPNQLLWISEAGGLTQFGAFVEIMLPGSRSSIKHWHSAEDEMVYVLAGEVTLCEGNTETVLRPGDAATFRAGEPVGHFLENRSAADTRCLVVGTRAPVDRITYPDHNLICHRDRSLPDDVFTDLEGNPAPNPHAR
jgi:uncharacterized cupin superfamily protein